MKANQIVYGIVSCLIFGGLVFSMSHVDTLNASPMASKTEMMTLGKKVYDEYCVTCHQKNGEGTPGVYPPLAKSDFLKKDRKGNIQNLLFGLEGEITVNGKKFNGVMPKVPEKYGDKDIAAVLTYVYNSFGNRGPVVSEKEVATLRAEGPPKAASSSGSKRKKK